MHDYQDLKKLVAQKELPAMLVDLDVLEQNTQRFLSIAKKHNKKLRLASKSIRVPALLKKIQSLAPETFEGLMTFSARESLFLFEQGFDDLLIAYPTTRMPELEACQSIMEKGGSVTLMADCEKHLQIYQQFFQEKKLSTPLKVCLDIDMSLKIFGLHLGVRRSPLYDIKDITKLLDSLTLYPGIKLVGLMGYEAQIAGLADSNPFSPLLNPIKKLIKKISIKDVYKKRQAIIKLCEQKKIELQFFNGGGSGSIDTTSNEPWITEITVGSGLLQSHLFDYYKNNQNKAALFFALNITRLPTPEIVTCQSGGFIASGEVSLDKQPIVYLPKDFSPIKEEGFGEVQTPLRGKSKLTINDPVFFRPTKAGEIAERFNSYFLFQKGKIVDEVLTYRGHHQSFY